jgi:hypothetical protein
MKYIGKIGEYLVLTKLLQNDIEAYQSIKSNQEHYDITVILSDNKVVRVQVKATELNDKSTNNSIDNLNKEYDFLIIVVISEHTRYFILSKNDVFTEKGNNIKLSTTRKIDNKYVIRDNIISYENKWDKIFLYKETP